MKHFILFLVLLFSHFIHAQNIFPEKYKGCNTDHFTLEKDSLKTTIDSKYLVKTILSGMSLETKSSIKGTLKLQIIVDLEGNSCLISIDNKTNIESSDLQLKNAIDTNLKWNIIEKVKVSPLIILKFKKKSVAISRIGVSGNFEMNEIFNDEIVIE